MSDFIQYTFEPYVQALIFLELMAIIIYIREISICKINKTLRGYLKGLMRYLYKRDNFIQQMTFVKLFYYD